MRASEFLIELDLPSVNYGSWLIKYKDMPDNNGMFQAGGSHPKFKGLIKGEGGSTDEAIQQVKDQIDQQNDSEREQRKTTINPADVTKVDVYFNAQFTRNILNNIPTAAKFIHSAGKPQLLVMTPEYFEDEAFMREYGMIRFEVIRASEKTEGGTRVYSLSGYGPRKVVQNGLEFGARYYVQEIDSDDDAYRKFDLMWDSVSQGRGDRKVLKGPGLTIASWIKGQPGAIG